MGEKAKDGKMKKEREAAVDDDVWDNVDIEYLHDCGDDDDDHSDDFNDVSSV